MPSIRLSGLSYQTPDGLPLFSNLTLNCAVERTGLVGRNGVGKSTLLAIIRGLIVPAQGDVRVDGTLGVLNQVVQFDADDTVADVFEAKEALAILRRAEQGQASIEELSEADWTLEARIEGALEKVGLDTRADTPLISLSGGQRTRIGLAAALFRQPDFLLLDEPTNNLDRGGRNAVLDLVSSWKTGAIVVSHDRELLEAMSLDARRALKTKTSRTSNWNPPGYKIVSDNKHYGKCSVETEKNSMT